MKRILATLISLIVLSMAALPAAAQTRGRAPLIRTPLLATIIVTIATAVTIRGTTLDDNSVYRTDRTYRNDGITTTAYDNRSVWQKHRDKLTTAGGAVAGALIGGMVGGKKGAIIGAVAGGASAAVYTYKIRDRYRRY